MAEEFDNTHTHTQKKKISHLVICIDCTQSADDTGTHYCLKCSNTPKKFDFEHFNFLSGPHCFLPKFHFLRSLCIPFSAKFSFTDFEATFSKQKLETNWENISIENNQSEVYVDSSKECYIQSDDLLFLVCKSTYQ